MEKVFVGTESDIRNHFIDSFSHGDRNYVVRIFKKEIRIFDARCPHARGDLRTAREEDGCLVCLSHGLRFSLRTGLVNLDDVGDDFSPGMQTDRIRSLALQFLPVENQGGKIYACID